MEEEEEDMYAPDEGLGGTNPDPSLLKDQNVTDTQVAGNDEEESDEEDSDSVFCGSPGQMSIRF